MPVIDFADMRWVADRKAGGGGVQGAVAAGRAPAPASLVQACSSCAVRQLGCTCFCCLHACRRRVGVPDGMDILDYLSHLGEAEQARARGVIEDIEEQALRDMQVRAQRV